MQTTNNIQAIDIPQKQDVPSLAEIVFHYLRYWKWFVLSIVILSVVVFIYLRYTSPVYKVSSLILIKDNQNGKTKLDYNAFADLGINMPSNDFDNEIELLRSKTLMRQVVDSLKINVSYYKGGRLKKRELYNNTPLFVSVNNLIKPGSFIIDLKENGLTIQSKEEKFYCTFQIEEEIVSPWGFLSFKANPLSMESLPVEVRLDDSYPVIRISPVNKSSNVIELSLLTLTPAKGKDIINTLVAIYNQRAIDEKNYVANRTINFINERLKLISGELKIAEQDVERYKRTQGLTDINAEAQLFLSASDHYDRQVTEMGIQLKILQSIKSFLLSPEHQGAMIPANVGLSDPTILALLQKYNEEILAKNRNMVGIKKDNPVFREYENRIRQLSSDLIKGIAISEAGMQTTLKELHGRETSYRSKVLGLSTQEREFRELYRQKEIKESLFVYLLQKQEETGLSLALATPNAIVVDSADNDPNPVSPQKKIILLAAFLIALIIPVAIIYIKDLFDNRLRGKDQLMQAINAPFLGEVPLTDKINSPFPVLNVRSEIAERFRIITSNLSFVVSQDKTNVIMITSSRSGEGKSFFSRNLAMSLATSGKRTLLIDFDIRKSMMNGLLGIEQKQGIVMYLSNPDLNITDIIDTSKTFNKNLDIIPVKVFPPNPAELLASKRLEFLFSTIKKRYDYIIIDTAPVGLVADAYRIGQFADATIFVVRSGYTLKTALPELNFLYKNNKLNNLTTVLNAVPISQYGYGNNKHNYYTEKE